MKFKTKTSPFFQSSNNISSVMLQVLLALIPGTLVMFYFFGWGILTNIVLAVVFALTLEVLALMVRKRPILPFVTDLSAVVTAWLLALSLPPLMPWWIIFVGIFFAIIVAKHLYGGLGYNPFNPAMVGYAVLIISFPYEMTQWIQPNFINEGSVDLVLKDSLGFLDSMKIVFSYSESLNWDAITMATPLDEVKTGLRGGIPYSEIINQSPYLENTSQNTWLWSSLAFILGGFWLLYKKLIHWQIPVSLLVSLALISAFFHLYSSDNFSSPLLHLFSGATILGAFFIATDPVSACTTPKGKIIYGASIGLLVFIIRTWGNYPDAIAFAVLIMNMAVPMIDYFTQPRTFGHKKAELLKTTTEGKQK